MARYHHLLFPGVEPETEFSLDGIQFVALKARKYEGNGFRRVLNMLDYCRSMLALIGTKKFDRPDVIIVSSPHPFGIFPGWILAKRYRARLVFEVRDLWPLSLIKINGSNKWHPFVVASALAERFAHARSDLFASLLAGGRRYAVERGLRQMPFVHVPNGVSPNRDTPQPPVSISGKSVSDQLDRWRSEKRMLIVHPGAQGRPNGLERLLVAVDILNRRGLSKEVGVLLLGEGARTDELVELAEKLKVENVVFCPTLPHREASFLVGKCDVGYAGGNDIPDVYRYGVSFNKLLEFMICGLPILLPVAAEGDPVTEAGCGLVVGGSNEEGIANAISTLISLGEAGRYEMGRRGQLYALENLTYDRIARRYIEALEAVEPRLSSR